MQHSYKLATFFLHYSASVNATNRGFRLSSFPHWLLLLKRCTVSAAGVYARRSLKNEDRQLEPEYRPAGSTIEEASFFSWFPTDQVPGRNSPMSYPPHFIKIRELSA